MLCTINDIIALMENIAPSELAEKDDSVGLIFGDRHGVARNVMVTLDVNDDVVEEAADLAIDLIISHHPVRLDGMKCINSDTYAGELIRKLAKNNIALFAAHTNLDSAPEGVNDTLCALLELDNIKVLEQSNIHPYKKIIVFAPVNYADIVSQTMCQAGAGNIGKYSDCTFLTEGKGTFRPQENAEPFIGALNELTELPEVRIEAIVPSVHVDSVINAVLKVHPYEEPVIDVIDLNRPCLTYGIGRVGDLAEPMLFNDFVNKVHDVLDAKNIKVVGRPDALVKRIAVVGGSGSPYFPLALNAGAQVFLSGEIKHHHALEAQYYGLQMVDVGHYASERPIIPVLIGKLMSKCELLQYDVELFESSVETEPFIPFK